MSTVWTNILAMGMFIMGYSTILVWAATLNRRFPSKTRGK